MSSFSVPRILKLGYPPPEAGLITAIGGLGFLVCAFFAAAFGDRLERKWWLPIGTIITLVGCVMIALGGQLSNPHAIPFVAFLGSIILFFGFNVWVPMTYTWSTENYPTRARTTGFGIVDGVGHIGGGFGLLVVALFAQSSTRSVTHRGIYDHCLTHCAVWHCYSWEAA